MYVNFIPSVVINSDLGIVNAARVSLAKQSEWWCEKHMHPYALPVQLYEYDELCEKCLSKPDTKLLHYLAQHNHWTPFGHSRLYFSIQWKSLADQLRFYKHKNLTGFSWLEYENADYIKGSLYSWVNALPQFSGDQQEYITHVIYSRYPSAAMALIPQWKDEPFSSRHGMLELNEVYIQTTEQWKLASATLLVKVPIFVARQIRTSQVGIAYSDLYVEGESFCFNEVSRRYVNSEPEFYTIPHWRVREGSSVKQGSTGVASAEQDAHYSNRADLLHLEASQLYQEGESEKIAPEQLRSFLPHSLYTEFYMTATLHRWAQWLSLRLDSHVQEETRYIVSRVLDTLVLQFPLWDQYYHTDAWSNAYIAL